MLSMKSLIKNKIDIELNLTKGYYFAEVISKGGKLKK
jgi:hypothetical protein